MRYVTYLTNRLIINENNYDEQIGSSNKKFHLSTLNNYIIQHIEIYSDFVTKLERIPLKSAALLETLKIEAETVTDIADNIFISCSYLKTLYLEIGITTIREKVFEPLKNLTSLQLITKYLRNIPKKIFRRNKKLKFLELHYFSDGKLNEIFSPLVDLEILKLFNHNLDDWGDKTLITDEHFAKNKNIYHLSLRNFDFSKIMPRIFHFLSQLKELVIYNSHLHELEDSDYGVLLYRLTNLRHLNLSQNRISNIKKTSFLYNPSLRALEMDSNRIQALKMLTFMKKNRIEWLSFSRNQVNRIKNTFFMNLEFLTYLNLSRNRIKEIHDLTFSYVNGLQILDLSNNWIEKINSKAFMNLNELRILRLESNRFNELSPYLVNLQFLLQSMNLNKCKLHSLDSSCFGNYMANKYSDFEEFHCRKNNLKHIDIDFFKCFPALKTVDLSSNELTDIGKKMFFNNKYLEKLNLHGNKINFIPKELFYNNWDLNSLNLSNNRITEIDKKTFRELNYLQTLILDYNKIEHISVKLFKKNHYLNYLSCNNNRLKSFDFEIITLTLIGTLDVSSNPIEEILSHNISSDVMLNRKLFVDKNFMDILRKKRCSFDSNFIGELIFNVNSTNTSENNLLLKLHRADD